MARGKRQTKALKQGAAKFIYKYFIGPLLYCKPKGMNLYHFLDLIFCVEDRVITRYRAKKTFKMPGLLWQQPNRLIPKGDRTIQKGDEVWVRTDKTMPDRIDVEVFAGQGKKNNVFALNRDALEKILPYLKEVPFGRKLKT